MHPLLTALTIAVGKLRHAESDLGRVEGSYGWNEKNAKVEAAEQEYRAALSAIETVLIRS